jgi:hypothetical protein
MTLVFLVIPKFALNLASNAGELRNGDTSMNLLSVSPRNRPHATNARQHTQKSERK